MSASPETSSVEDPSGDSRAVVFFDAECGLCDGFVGFALKRDRARHLRFEPLQSEYARRVLAGRGIDPAASGTMLVLDGDRLLKRSDAVAAVLRRLPAPWRLGGLIRFLPRAWRDGVYRVVARNRRRWFGRPRASR